jgi:retinol-binding protein 3
MLQESKTNGYSIEYSIGNEAKFMTAVYQRRILKFIIKAACIVVLISSGTLIVESQSTNDLPINNVQRTEVIEELLRQLNESYVYPDTAAQMEKSIRAKMRERQYERITSGLSLAQTLTAHLHEIYDDKHLGVSFSYKPIPAGVNEPSPADRERFRQMASAMNFGFEKLERLSGNIGYMELNGFINAELGADTAIAAMQFLANTDALIVDLRYNGGGVPGLAQLISSYLFRKPVHLHSIEWREGNRIEQFWTLPFVPGQRYIDKPVYILMSKRTLSAPESFAYNLQALKRAVIVGERSAGGANPGKQFRISEHFAVFIPTGRAINPITGTNWEGTGIKPDIEVPAAEALKTAHLAALRKLLESSVEEKKEQLKTAIREVEKQQ